MLFLQKKTDPPTDCTTSSKVYGFMIPLGVTPDTMNACRFGSLNPTTGALAVTSTVQTSIYTNQAAFNTSDNCYYVFNTYMGAYLGHTLSRISTTGAATSLSNTDTFLYCFPCYNRATNKLYCIRYDRRSLISFASDAIVELSVTSPYYSAAVVIPTIHGIATGLTADSKTGDLYYSTKRDTGSCYVEKYHPGSAATVVDSIIAADYIDIVGLRYNDNSGKLYAIVEKAYAGLTDFTQIDPMSGGVTTLSHINVVVNPELFSSCVETCSNHYIFSTFTGSMSVGVPVVQTLDMSGTVVRTDTIPSIIQGLEAN